ncbi:MAG: TonB-dependent receptor, partial [bacterium]
KFRYPTLKEGEYFSRFGPPGGFKVDPEIKPEKMFDNQFGASFSSRLFFIKLEFHYRNVKDMIGVKGSFPNLVQSNLTEYEGYGSGIIYKLIPINGLELNGNVSQEIKKKGILIGPEASINLGIKYTFYGVTTKLKCGYLKNPGQTDAPLPDVFTVDWDVSYSFKKLGFYLEGNNLLDREYELIKGYKMPGRNFGGGIRVEF